MSSDKAPKAPTIAGLAAEAAGPLASFGLISMVSNLLMLVGSLFMLQVYDRVLPSRSLPTLAALLVLVVLLYLVYAAIETLRSRMTARFATLFEERVSPLAFEAGVRARLGIYGPVQADPVRDLDSVRAFLGGAGPSVFFDLPWLPVYLGAIFLLHPLLGWITVVGAVVIGGLLILTEVAARKPSKELSVAASQRQAQTDDTRNAVEAVVAMGLMGSMLRRWRVASETQARASLSSIDRNSFFSSLSKAFRMLLQSVVLAMGAYLVIRNEMSGGVMIAASILSSRALAPIEQAVAQWRTFVAARQAWARLNKMLIAVRQMNPEVSLPLPRAAIAVRQLVAGPSRQQPLVTGVSFELSAGEAMAILGPSGSGKSSLVRALIGAWPPLGGDIRLDGSELTHFHEGRRGQFIGYLGQQVDLFAGTVAENITRFAGEPDEKRLFTAASSAGIHEMVAALPNGYDTMIGPGGSVLSAGQRQRVGLARALYGDPFLLVLDEPNSNLDADGDAALNEAVVAAKERGAIVILVAHRPSALAAVDKVLYVKGGRQQAFGPKDEVLPRITQPVAPTKLRPVAATQNG
jgi:ATP-binding cassette subfamily C protein PrsD